MLAIPPSRCRNRAGVFHSLKKSLKGGVSVGVGIIYAQKPQGISRHASLCIFSELVQVGIGSRPIFVSKRFANSVAGFARSSLCSGVTVAGRYSYGRWFWQCPTFQRCAPYISESLFAHCRLPCTAALVSCPFQKSGKHSHQGCPQDCPIVE